MEREDLVAEASTLASARRKTLQPRPRLPAVIRLRSEDSNRTHKLELRTDNWEAPSILIYKYQWEDPWSETIHTYQLPPSVSTPLWSYVQHVLQADIDNAYLREVTGGDARAYWGIRVSEAGMERILFETDEGSASIPDVADLFLGFTRFLDEFQLFEGRAQNATSFPAGCVRV